jgi:hypothetical protein
MSHLDLKIMTDVSSTKSFVSYWSMQVEGCNCVNSQGYNYLVKAGGTHWSI